jgi:PAS domain S-box-containing protein
MTPTTVLVVEDEALVASHLEACLKGFGYGVRCASSGEEALELACRAAPHLALMDIRLAGDLDGIQTAVELRRLGIPSIFLTAYADEEILERAKKAEPLGYLVKPFRERELRATLEMALRRAAIEKRLRERELWHYAILDTLREPVLLTDVTGRLSAMNRAAERMTGWRGEEARGLRFEELLAGFDAGAVGRRKEGLRRAIREKAPVEVGGEAVRLDKREGPAYTAEAILPMVDEAGALNGAALVFRERSETSCRAAPPAPAAVPEPAAAAPAIDPQTGLPGRAEAERAIAQAHRQGSRAFAAVFVIDHIQDVGAALRLHRSRGGDPVFQRAPGPGFGGRSAVVALERAGLRGSGRAAGLPGAGAARDGGFSLGETGEGAPVESAYGPGGGFLRLGSVPHLRQRVGGAVGAPD